MLARSLGMAEEALVRLPTIRCRVHAAYRSILLRVRRGWPGSWFTRRRHSNPELAIMATGGRVVVVGWLRVEELSNARHGVHRRSLRQPDRSGYGTGRQEVSGRDCSRGSEGELAHPFGSRKDGNHFNGWYITRPIRHVNQDSVASPLSLLRRQDVAQPQRVARISRSAARGRQAKNAAKTIAGHPCRSGRKQLKKIELSYADESDRNEKTKKEKTSTCAV